MITKSGPSAFHAGAYEFLRNLQINAAGFLTNRSGKPPIPGRNEFRPPQRFNQFGVTAGGPLAIPKIYTGQNRPGGESSADYSRT
jgi:hypothetical protein